MTKNSSDIENKTDVSIAGMLAYRWFDEETPQHILFALHAIMTQESFTLPAKDKVLDKMFLLYPC